MSVFYNFSGLKPFKDCQYPQSKYCLGVCFSVQSLSLSRSLVSVSSKLKSEVLGSVPK